MATTAGAKSLAGGGGLELVSLRLALEPSTTRNSINNAGRLAGRVVSGAAAICKRSPFVHHLECQSINQFRSHPTKLDDNSGGGTGGLSFRHGRWRRHGGRSTMPPL
jgi:hypothetical protein